MSKESPWNIDLTKLTQNSELKSLLWSIPIKENVKDRTNLITSEKKLTRNWIFTDKFCDATISILDKKIYNFSIFILSTQNSKSNIDEITKFHEKLKTIILMFSIIYTSFSDIKLKKYSESIINKIKQIIKILIENTNNIHNEIKEPMINEFERLIIYFSNYQN